MVNAMVLLVLLDATFGLECHKCSKVELKIDGELIIDSSTTSNCTTEDCDDKVGCGTYSTSFDKMTKGKRHSTLMKIWQCNVAPVECEGYTSAMERNGFENVKCKMDTCNTEKCNDPSGDDKDDDKDEYEIFSGAVQYTASTVALAVTLGRFVWA